MTSVAPKTIADALGDRLLSDDRFVRSFGQLEQVVGDSFLVGVGKGSQLDDVVVSELLRAADLLSHSSRPRHRELSYQLVALLADYDAAVGLGESRERYATVAKAVLIQLGNFPAIKTLENSLPQGPAMPVSRLLLRLAKEIVQSTARGDAVLTDGQFQIAQALRQASYFSFSGPTSLGKSFILKDALFEIVQRPELDDKCVVMVVPTKALITQTANDLRELFRDLTSVHVATFPSTPKILRRRHPTTVFVLTPERLLRYLSNPTRDIEYLIVDEAHKIVAKSEPRASIYYHAISEAARNFATKLIFASPSVTNPELFLDLFQRATSRSMAVTERVVTQQRYFVDLLDKRQVHLSTLSGTPRQLADAPTESDPLKYVVARAGDRKSIVYTNSPRSAGPLAQRLAAMGPIVQSPEVAEVVAFIRDFVHKDYFLATCLERGVAFHHGRMPHEVREKVERLFASRTSGLQFVVCTSTLLEGVNMPAKNIFVLSDKQGARLLSHIDFENLVGRAGRLTHDFSGNVVCIRAETKRWEGASRELLKPQRSVRLDSFIVDPGQTRKDYTDIERVLRGKPLPKATSEDARRNAQQYASILLLHQMGQQSTPLRDHFIEKVKNGSEVLKLAAKGLTVPQEILRRAPAIPTRNQQRVWDHLQGVDAKPLLGPEADTEATETFHGLLSRLCDLYDWRTEEAQGRDPLIPRNGGRTADSVSNRLWYWAILMRSWVRGDTLNRVIRESIAHHRKTGVIVVNDYSSDQPWSEEAFNPNSPVHINIVIEQVLMDLEGGLRFRILGYLQNFYELSVAAMGPDRAGVNVATLVEYGTADQRLIELQEFGLSRGAAAKVLERFGDLLAFSASGELEDMNIDRLLESTEGDTDLYAELATVLAAH